MTGWWISWYSDVPLPSFELHSPWWVSGEDADGHETVVAAVRAKNEDEARWQILRAYDTQPDDVRWRFCEALTHDTPFTDRFPKAVWMAWDDKGTCMCAAKHGGPR